MRFQVYVSKGEANVPIKDILIKTAHILIYWVLKGSVFKLQKRANGQRLFEKKIRYGHDCREGWLHPLKRIKDAVMKAKIFHIR